MREAIRIPEILEHLARIWKDNPDFKLGQLIATAASSTKPLPEVFYLEDNQLLKGLLDLEEKLNK